MKRTLLILAGLAFFTIKNQSQTVADADGNLYDTVVIGTQVWLKENLRTTHYNNGDPIPNVTASGAWAGLTSGARCYYDNDSVSNDSVYGPLYNWYAATDTRNLCPSGWRISSNAEWTAAETFLGGNTVAGGQMKEAGTLHWLNPNTGATNSSGFTGLPGGMRDPLNNNFRTIGENGLWWTSTAYNGSMAWSTYMWNQFAGVDHNPGSKKYGFSIRCMKDVATGLGNNDSPGKIRIYPNPSAGKITIEPGSCKDSHLLVYNIFGKIVVQKELTGNSNLLDISDLPRGVYLLAITGERWTMQQKIIKE